MDVDIAVVGVDERGRMDGETTRRTIEAMDPSDRARICAVVATAGSTNAGIVDDLAGVGALAREIGAWFHVDGAYGGAALCAGSRRHLYTGVETADSFIVDPHKWLFAPFDSCALLYRDPGVARAAHTQRAEYLDALHVRDEWNPSDYAHHLSRRPRGLPLWFSLATHGTRAYADAVETTLRTTEAAARMISASAHLRLLIEPELSVVLFERVGWDAARYQQWSDDVLAAGLTFAVPTTWRGSPCLRLCIVNPETTPADVDMVLESLR